MTVRQRATLQLLRDLRRVPCADCGGIFPPFVMDFDHRDPTQKRFSIAAGKSLLKNRVVLMAEIAKCDIVCANCHAMRTKRQQAIYRWGWPRGGAGDVLKRSVVGGVRKLSSSTGYVMCRARCAACASRRSSCSSITAIRPRSDTT